VSFYAIILLIENLHFTALQLLFKVVK